MMKLETIILRHAETSLGTNLLSRQVNLQQRGKTGSLLTRKKRDKLIFRENKELTDEALEACRLLVINPEALMPKTLDEFAEPGITQNVQEIRFKHYRDKRESKHSLFRLSLGNLAQVEEFIR